MGGGRAEAGERCSVKLWVVRRARACAYASKLPFNARARWACCADGVINTVHAWWALGRGLWGGAGTSSRQTKLAQKKKATHGDGRNKNGRAGLRTFFEEMVEEGAGYAVRRRQYRARRGARDTKRQRRGKEAPRTSRKSLTKHFNSSF